MATIDLRNPGSDEILLSSASTSPISGSTVGLSTANASLAGDGALAGSTSGLSTGAASLVGTGELVGSTVCLSFASGSLAGAGALDGAALGLALGSGEVVAQAAGTIFGSTLCLSLTRGTGTLTGEALVVGTGGRSKRISAFQRSLRPKVRITEDKEEWPQLSSEAREILEVAIAAVIQVRDEERYGPQIWSETRSILEVALAAAIELSSDPVGASVVLDTANANVQVLLSDRAAVIAELEDALALEIEVDYAAV